MTAEEVNISKDCMFYFDGISGDEERLCEDGAQEHH
jgi:hypothetical protein